MRTLIFITKIFADILLSNKNQENPKVSDLITKKYSDKDKTIEIVANSSNSKIPIHSSGDTPVQISLIISNDKGTKKSNTTEIIDKLPNIQVIKEEKLENNNKMKKSDTLTDLLLNNTLDFHTATGKEYKFEKDDISELFKISSEVKKLSEELSKITERLDKIINKPPQGEKSVHKDVVNYHLIEITENNPNRKENK